MINLLAKTVNVLCLVRGGHRYAFIYRDDQVEELQRTLGRFAARPDLAFTRKDAEELGRRVRDHQRKNRACL